MQTVVRLLLILLLPCASFGAIINVPADQPTIQAGIIAASDFDTVLVAPGIYSGDGNRDIDFGGKKIYLLGGGSYGADVIIQCGGSELDPHIGFWFHTGEDSSAVVDGFTVTGAYKPFDAPLTGFLGAIQCQGSSPRIVNCTVSDNAHHGIMVINGGRPVISNCRVERNLNGIRVGRVPMFGGAHARIERTLVMDNDSCGIQLFDSGDHFIEDCLIRNNAVDGIYKFVDLPKPVATEPFGQNSYVRRTIVVDNGRYGLFNYWVGEIIAECTDSYGNDSANFWGVDASAGDALGNLSADPLFCFPDTGNFNIRDNSPCAPANNSCHVQMGPYGVKCSCCIGCTGNLNQSANETPDLGDFSLLIAYLTMTPRPILLCPSEANVDGRGKIDVSDISWMIAMLTVTPKPICIPCPRY